MFKLPNPTTFESLKTKENVKFLNSVLEELNEKINDAVKFGYSGLRWYIDNNEYVVMGIIRELETYPQYKYIIKDQFWNSEKKIIITWKDSGKIYKPIYYDY